MQPTLRLIDPCAPKSYAEDSDLAGLGGTEATVLRIVYGLAKNLQISVEQVTRRDSATYDNLTFTPMNLTAQVDCVTVVINSWKVAIAVAKRNPAARVMVWQHVVPGRHNRAMAGDLVRYGIMILCVSHSLRNTLKAMVGDQVPMEVFYNPISETIQPDATPRDRDLLVFASAPHKGLDQVLQAFVALQTRIPTLKLEVADPGYLSWHVGDLPSGVTRLGVLPHAKVINRMRRALCLFYPQQRFAETFGLVIAEANAVGTPALLHRGLGANDEVASDPTQCVDGSNPDQIADQIQRWRATRPIIRAKPAFRLDQVLATWRAVLSDDIALTSSSLLCNAD